MAKRSDAEEGNLQHDRVAAQGFTTAKYVLATTLLSEKYIAGDARL